MHLVHETLLCEWTNASLPRGRHGPNVRFQMCIYPKARLTDRYISWQIKEKGFWEQHMVQDMLSVLSSQRQHRPLLVDIGANIGFYTLAAAAAGFDVYAFEPVPRNAEMLRVSLGRNRLAHRVTLHTFALGQGPTTLSMGVSSDNQGEVSHLKNLTNHPYGNGDVRLASLPLNSVLPRVTTRPIYLKVDIEGGECEALAGASNLFSASRIVGANIEMQLVTRRCCVRQGWQAPGGLFYHMRNTHSLCSFSHGAPVANPCNVSTNVWDVQWHAC